MGGWIFVLGAGIHLIHNHRPVSDAGCSHGNVLCAAGGHCGYGEAADVRAAGDARGDDALGTACSACAFLNQYKVPRRDVSPAISVPAVISLYSAVTRYHLAGNAETLPLVPRAPPGI